MFTACHAASNWPKTDWCRFEVKILKISDLLAVHHAPVTDTWCTAVTFDTSLWHHLYPAIISCEFLSQYESHRQDKQLKCANTLNGFCINTIKNGILCSLMKTLRLWLEGILETSSHTRTNLKTNYHYSFTAFAKVKFYSTDSTMA